MSCMALFSTSVSAADSTVSCVNVNQSEIAQLFDKWNAALQTGDANQVAANYAENAVLLPTVSNKVRLTTEERIDYFEHFLDKKPIGVIDSQNIIIGCNDAINTGTYTFTYANGEKTSARYTFTYVWDGKEWKISTHHSSQMPEATSANSH